MPGPQVTACETFSETRFTSILSHRVSLLCTFSITSFDTQRFSFICFFLSSFVLWASRARPTSKSQAVERHRAFPSEGSVMPSLHLRLAFVCVIVAHGHPAVPAAGHDFDRPSQALLARGTSVSLPHPQVCRAAQVDAAGAFAERKWAPTTRQTGLLVLHPCLGVCQAEPRGGPGQRFRCKGHTTLRVVALEEGGGPGWESQDTPLCKGGSVPHRWRGRAARWAASGPQVAFRPELR